MLILFSEEHRFTKSADSGQFCEINFDAGGAFFTEVPLPGGFCEVKTVKMETLLHRSHFYELFLCNSPTENDGISSQKWPVVRGSVKK